MPSHQIRVQQNNCDHVFPYMHMRDKLDFDDLNDGRKCCLCGINYDKAMNRKPRSDA